MQPEEHNQLLNAWCHMAYSDVVNNVSTSSIRIKQKSYLSKGQIPVIDQGRDFIGGYTNDENFIVDCVLPVLIFGDHTRAVKYVKEQFAAGADGVKVLEPLGMIQPKLLEYFTKYLAVKLKDKGYARHYQFLAKCTVPIPPLNEQTRIVEKIEELFSELDKGVESLKTAQQQLKVYRQALLKQAFEGKLTEQWRKDNPDKVEPAEQLLARIKAEREARYQQQLDDWKQAVKAWEAAGKEGKKPAKPRQQEIFTLKPEEISQLPQLPNSWDWVSLNELVSGLPRSIQSGPFGSNLRHSEFQHSGVFVIGIDNVHDGEFSVGSQHRISPDKFEELKKYKARPGDLLVTVMASLGRTCVVPRDFEKAIITKHVYRFTLEQKFLLPEFYNLVLQSHTVSRVRMFENAQGQTRLGLNSSILKELPMPLCNLAEQQEIHGRLSAQLSSLNHLEQEITINLQRSRALRQSILKKAFSGQLVPQNPSDEPASVLLERIRAEREAAELAEKQAKTKAKKTAPKRKPKATKATAA